MELMDYCDICNVLDREIKDTVAKKDSYIQKNGYDDYVGRFDVQIATISRLYGKFREAMKEV